MDAAVAAAFTSELGGIFTFTEEHKVALKGFSRWTTLFCFTPEWLWFRQTLHWRAAS